MCCVCTRVCMCVCVFFTVNVDKADRTAVRVCDVARINAAFEWRRRKLFFSLFSFSFTLLSICPLNFPPPYFIQCLNFMSFCVCHLSPSVCPVSSCFFPSPTQFSPFYCLLRNHVCFFFLTASLFLYPFPAPVVPPLIPTSPPSPQGVGLDAGHGAGGGEQADGEEGGLRRQHHVHLRGQEQTGGQQAPDHHHRHR